MDSKTNSVSLYELQLQIKSAVEQTLEGSYWVVAEISELKVNNSGHCYMELVEKGGRNQIPKAKANAVIWRSTFGFLEDFFRQQTGVGLNAGINVLLKVEVGYHELYGLSLVIKDIDPSYTLGDMERQRQETIRRLKEDGVFDMNRELELPLVMQRIAVVSSDKAAGNRDFMKEILANEYGYAIEAILFNAVMQGHQAEHSVIDALDAIAFRADEFDAVVIVRGGGSQSELGGFDSYRLCSHIAQFPLPAITGIGHDKDVSVADMVAAVSVKTPTAAARYLIDAMRTFETGLIEIKEEFTTLITSRITEEKSLLFNLGLRLKNSVQTAVHEADKWLGSLKNNLDSKTFLRIRSERNHLQYRQSELRQFARKRLESAGERIDGFCRHIDTGTTRYLADQHGLLDLLSARVEGRNPERIMKMGYSLVKVRGKTVKSISQVDDGDIIGIYMSDGSLTAHVRSKKPR